jgi:CheY-like chemotaxis protein
LSLGVPKGLAVLLIYLLFSIGIVLRSTTSRPMVNDDEDALQSMGTRLTTCGATVTTAASDVEVLEVLRGGGKQQHVLVSDIGLPNLDDYALLRAVRALNSDDGAIVPAVAVTAYTGPVDRLLALAVGFRLPLSSPSTRRTWLRQWPSLPEDVPPHSGRAR